MEITLQYFNSCPNWKITDQHLRELIREMGLDTEVHYHVVDTPEQAEQVSFRGSPTVRIDGLDPFAEPDAPAGLSCRVYATEDGPAGSPTKAQLAQAIEAAS